MALTGLTLTKALTETVPHVAVISAEPTPTAVILPFLSMVATLLLLEFQVTVLYVVVSG